MHAQFRSLLVFLLLLSPSISFAYTASSEDARNRAEALLEKSGGRSAWIDVKAVRLLAVNRFPGFPLPTLFEVFVNFEKPGSMTRLYNQDFNRLRAFLGDHGWSGKDEGERTVTEFNEQRLALEWQLWEGNFSRNIWRIATRDKTLNVRIDDQNRLVLENQNGKLVTWFVQDNEGHATRFGFPFDTEKGLELGPYGKYGIRAIPQTGTTEEGVTFESLYLRAFDTPHQIPDAAPEDFMAYNP